VFSKSGLTQTRKEKTAKTLISISKSKKLSTFSGKTN
jgi:hypothetical protein